MMRRNALLIIYRCIIGVLLLLANHPTAKAIRIVPNQNQNPPSDETDPSSRRRRLEQDVVHRHLKKTSSSSSSSTIPTTPTSPDDHLVTSLPLLHANALTTPHWAGLLPASPDQDKYLFYWLFAPDTSATTTDDGTTTKPKDEDIPLIIWLNGGPGCSSMDGLFLENGPLRFELVEGQDNTYQLTTTPFSWHHSPAYVVYIDQPVGTGLSYTTSGKYPGSDEQVNQDFYYFLQQLVQLHADKFLTKSSSSSASERRSLRRPLYFTGESHAGHYIPSMMAYILQQNDDATSSNVLLPLAGAAIGNGWVDPRYQYAAAHAAYGHGLIGIAQRNALDQAELSCRSAVEENWPVNIPHQRELRLLNEQSPPQSSSQQPIHSRKLADTGMCFALLDDVVSETQQSFKVSQYDVRVWEAKGRARTFPAGHKIVEAYLGDGHAAQFPEGFSNEKVLQAIHATASRDAGQVYQECTDPPYNALAHQDGLGVVPEVVQVLEYHKGSDLKNKVRLLFFNGIYDLICNHVGNEIFLENMPWSHREDWIKAARYAWRAKNIKEDSPYANSMVSGYYKVYENLAFLKVMDSGHMVPMDVPDVALDMIRTFVYQQEFEQYKQGLSRSTTAPQCEACPECPAPSSSNTTPKDNSKTNASSSDQQSQETNELGRFVIAHAWMGAILGVVVFGMAILCKRQQHRRIDVVPQYSLELQSNPPNNGINVANVTYRDQEPSSFDDEEDDDEDDVVDYEGGGGGGEFQYKNELSTNGHGGRTPKSKPTII